MCRTCVHASVEGVVAKSVRKAHVYTTYYYLYGRPINILKPMWHIAQHSCGPVYDYIHLSLHMHYMKHTDNESIFGNLINRIDYVL